MFLACPSGISGFFRKQQTSAAIQVSISCSIKNAAALRSKKKTKQNGFIKITREKKKEPRVEPSWELKMYIITLHLHM